MLQKFHTFQVVVECQSYTEAAKRLYCTQPTVTNHIQQLEDHYQMPLFTRQGGRLIMTKEGEILYEYIEQLNVLLKKAQTEMQRSFQKEQLPLYMSNYIAQYFFFHLYDQVDSTLASRLTIHSYCYDELKRQLLNREARFALMPHYVADVELQENTTFHPLFEDEFVLIFSSTHPFYRRKKLYVRDLQNETILLTQSEYLNEEIIEAFQLKSLRHVRVGTFEMTKQFVALNRGIAFLPYRAVDQELLQGQLHTLPLSSFQYKRKSGIQLLKDVILSEGERQLMETLLALFRQDASKGLKKFYKV